MAVPNRSQRTIATGPRGTVEYAVQRDGTLEARDWLDSETQELRASFGVLFQRLVTEGRITNTQQFRRLKDEVWEFKRHGHRLLCFQLGSRWLLTHRIKKAGGLGKCPPSEINKADRIGHEHIAWEARQNKGN